MSKSEDIVVSINLDVDLKVTYDRSTKLWRATLVRGKGSQVSHSHSYSEYKQEAIDEAIRGIRLDLYRHLDQG